MRSIFPRKRLEKGFTESLKDICSSIGHRTDPSLTISSAPRLSPLPFLLNNLICSPSLSSSLPPSVLTHACQPVEMTPASACLSFDLQSSMKAITLCHCFGPGSEGEWG